MQQRAFRYNSYHDEGTRDGLAFQQGPRLHNPLRNLAASIEGSSPRHRALSSQQHRLMWTPELAIREISDAVETHRLSGRSTRNDRPVPQLDIRSVSATTSTPTTQATAALEFETTSAATTAERSFANSSSFAVHHSTSKRMAHASPHPSSNHNTKHNAYRSRSARVMDEEQQASVRRYHGLDTSPREDPIPRCDVSPIHIDLSAAQQYPFTATPDPKFLPNDTTMSSSGRLREHSRLDNCSPRSDPQDMRHEIADLRLQLFKEQKRSEALHQELQAAKNVLNDTSIHVDVRERECVELNDFVDALQKRCTSLENDLSLARKEVALQRKRNDSPHCSTSEFQESQQKAEPLSNNPQPLDDDVHLLAPRLAQATLEIAQMKAVLDRLGLHPPYPQELIGSARKHVRAFTAIQ